MRLQEAAQETQRAVPSYEDTRDITSFARRAGRLPEQLEGDAFDYRGLLNRDGSVLSAVTAAELAAPDALYAALGCKTVVGLPFKDISTSDTLLLREPPAADDEIAQQTLKRLMDVAVLPVVPAAALSAAPIEGAVALLSLEELADGAEVPACAARVVLSVRGDEEEAMLAKLNELEHAFLLLDPPPTLSRLHAARRLFSLLGALGVDSAVVHHYRWVTIATGLLRLLHASAHHGAPPPPALPSLQAARGRRQRARPAAGHRGGWQCVGLHAGCMRVAC